uniref:Eukaryotic translation initiation factor 3 subunit F-2 n=1 Tax=Drosophila pseudoobscura pseudoobscura TaxID=46245 RepID=EI3F2_DROPS|nr:RecName: Full=Eukaryotic translation initiation factor 3 subunit F-2; Short=eIF3f-2; AltName: Full=Eukaryotic translation initiation factor 3 subunit 5-2 [Drosophila pseudoobscura pseudoobscura]
MSLSNFNLQSKVLLHPLVLFQIIDAYERRAKDVPEVLGTLLGTVAGKTGRIEITNCFSVVHRMHGDNNCHIDLDLKYDNDMLELAQIAYPQEKVLGWFSTGKSVSAAAVELHEYYERQCHNGQPLHLLMDTSLRGQRMNTRIFCAVATGVPGGTKGLMFSLLPMDIYFGSPDIVAMRHMGRQCAQPTKDAGRLLPELEQVVDATKDIQQKLDLVLRYINDILNRKRRPDNTVGRALHDVLTSVPMVEAERFRHMFNTNMRDLLMSLTLSSMIKTQLQLSERLSNMVDA